MSTNLYVGQKDYIAKLNEIDDAFSEAINAATSVTKRVKVSL
jgi:hypothetical protein